MAYEDKQQFHRIQTGAIIGIETDEIINADLKALHEQKIKSDGFKLGYEWKMQGFDLEDAPSEYSNMDEFRRGYENAILFIMGCEWFEKGFLLKDAPKDIKRRRPFVDGFKSIQFKLAGRDWFNQGHELKDAVYEEKSNPYFVEGYNLAREEAKKR